MHLSGTPDSLNIEELKKEIEFLRQENKDLNTKLLSCLENNGNENEISEREQRYSEIFDLIEEGFCIVEMYIEEGKPLDFRFIETNRAFEKQSVLKNVKGRWMRDLSHVQEESWFEIYRDVALTGKPIRFENGSNDDRWLSVYAFRIGKPEQRLVAILFSDITQKRITEEALVSSEERYRNLVESANIIILRLDPNGIIKFANEYTFQFFGYTREEMIGQDVRMIVPATEFSGRDLSNLVENVLSRPQDYSQVENENILRNGEHVWFSWTNRTITGKDGDIIEILSIGTNITERKKAESALLVEHNILEAVVSNIGTGFVVADINGNILSLNNAALRIHEFLSEEDRLQRFEQYIHEFDLEFPDGSKVPHDQWPLAKALRGEYIRDFNVKLIRNRSHSEKSVCYNTIPIYDNYQNRTLIVLTMTDFTDIYSKTDELTRERELFEGIFNNIPVMITIYEPELKNFRFNKEYVNILGWREEDTADGSLMEKVYPNPDYRLEVANYMQSLKPGWKEWILTAKDGSHVVSNWANILLSSGIIIGIGIDERQRREAEKKLRESENRLHMIFDNAAIGIVEVDSDNRFVSVNERSCKILGYTSEELINRYISEITAPEDRQLSYELNTKLIKGEVNIFDYEKRYIKKDGSLLWVHVTVSAIRDSYGEFLNSIGTFEDISKRKEVEQALRESEEMFSKLFQSIPVGIALSTTSQGAYFKVNRAWLEILDFEAEQEVLGKTSVDLGLIPDPVNREKIMNEFHVKGYVRDAEMIFITRKGTKKIVSINMDLITIRGEKYILAANTDITERKNAEDAIKRSETILKHAGILTNLGAWEIEYDSQIDVMKNPLRWSDQVYRIFGYPPGSVSVSNDLFYSHVHPDDRQKTKDALARAINENIPFIIEHRIIRADGTERKVIEHADVLFDQSGNLLRVIGAVQDITERKREEQKLKDSEEKFRSLFENITEGVAMHELVYKDGVPSDYRIIGINPAFSEITGLKTEEVTDLLASEVYGSDPPPFLHEYADVATTGKPMRFDTFYPPMNRHFVISAISPKKDQFATVFEDITDQKRNEYEIKQRNEELTRFIYTVSHDLKSPLVTIKSFTSYLKEDIENQDKEAQNKDLNYIQNAADKMGKLLDELLELSRIGRKEEPKTKVKLETIAQAALDLVAGWIVRRNIKIRFEGPQVMLYGHSQRLIQLYQNLLDNAAKFMGDQPEPLVEIGSFFDKEKKEIVLFVRDNGSGIDPRYKHKIFGLFEKMDNNSEGTGIGLALVKRIVEVHGGSIWFKSEGIGKGTTFYFTLEGTESNN